MVSENEPQPQQQPQEQQPQRPQTQPRLPTLMDLEFSNLGITLFIALQREFHNDKYNFQIFQYGYCAFLKRHPEFIVEYNDALNNDDYHVGSNIVINIAQRVKNGIKYFVIGVQGSFEEIKQKIVEVTCNPQFQGRERTIEIIRSNFVCDENDLQRMIDYLHSINIYNGSLLSPGMTENGNSVLIIHTFSMD